MSTTSASSNQSIQLKYAEVAKYGCIHVVEDAAASVTRSNSFGCMRDLSTPDIDEVFTTTHDTELKPTMLVLRNLSMKYAKRCHLNV